MAEPNLRNVEARNRESSPDRKDAPTKWHRVESKHKQLVEVLNETPVSFTVRSAEGLAMYEGLDSHSANGRMRDLAEKGLRTLAGRVRSKPDVKSVSDSSQQ